MVNGIQSAEALVDHGCLSYATINGTLVKSLNLPNRCMRNQFDKGFSTGFLSVCHAAYAGAAADYESINIVIRGRLCRR